jgi:hypothetical protein
MNIEEVFLSEVAFRRRSIGNFLLLAVFFLPFHFHTANDDGGLSDNGIRLLIDEAKKQARVEPEISPSEVADLSILREAQKELGIKTK